MRSTFAQPLSHAEFGATVLCYSERGDQLDKASALNELGAVLQMFGDYMARICPEQALGIYRQIGSRLGEAAALNEVGAMYRVSGQRSRAESCHRQALELAHATGTS